MRKTESEIVPTRAKQYKETSVMDAIGNETDSTLNSNVTASESLALHSVVRAMHDGICPKCGYLGSANSFVHDQGHSCPKCQFFIAWYESNAALETFRPYMEMNLAVFEKWRSH